MFFIVGRYWVEYCSGRVALTGVRTDGGGNTWVHYAAWLGSAAELKAALASAAVVAAAGAAADSDVLPGIASSSSAAAAAAALALLTPNNCAQTPVHLACMRGDSAMVGVVMQMTGR